MRIAEIFELGYGGGWDDHDYDHYKHRRHYRHYRHYDDDDDGLNIDIDLL